MSELDLLKKKFASTLELFKIHRSEAENDSRHGIDINLNTSFWPIRKLEDAFNSDLQKLANELENKKPNFHPVDLSGEVILAESYEIPNGDYYGEVCKDMIDLYNMRNQFVMTVRSAMHITGSRSVRIEYTAYDNRLQRAQRPY